MKDYGFGVLSDFIMRRDAGAFRFHKRNIREFCLGISPGIFRDWQCPILRQGKDRADIYAESCQSGRSCSTRNAVPVKGPGFESLTLRQDKNASVRAHFNFFEKARALMKPAVMNLLILFRLI